MVTGEGDKFKLETCIEIFKGLDKGDDDESTRINRQVTKWLSELNIKRQVKMIDGKDLIILCKLITDALKETFTTKDISFDVQDDGVIFIFSPFCLIELNKEGEKPFMVVSFETYTSAIVGSNLILLLKEIFKGDILIADDCYAVDEANGDWYWGKDEIQRNYEKIHGKRISPYIHYGWFDDGSDNGMPHC